MDTIGQGPGSLGEGDGSSEPDAFRDALSSKTDKAAHPPAAVHSLKQAMRRARFDDAERSGAVSDLRAARIGRLEVLQEALKPLLAQIPSDVDCFDVGIMPGANPRLFIDMIGFIEMARDPRVYAFFQDTRHGRVKLAESESVDAMVEAATHYVARRLLERDKALASDLAVDPATPPAKIKGLKSERVKQPVTVAWHDIKDEKQAGARSTGRSFVRGLGIIFAFIIDVLGSMTFFSLLAFAAWIAWSTFKH